MKKVLLVIAFLGCLAVVTAQQGTFEFTDSNGQCWRCHPGKPCERCAAPVFRGRIIPNWPDTCPAPDCNDPANRGVLFPHPTLRKYYQCDPNGGSWSPTEMECPCDTLFSFQDQRCMGTWEFVPHCNFEISDPQTVPCDQVPGPDPGPTPPPTEETTPGDDDTTAVTTRAPCVCVIWWPCMCNPCMMWPRPPSCMMIG